jgi:ribosomal protein S18 acetylase RimI-like enzyme
MNSEDMGFWSTTTAAPTLWHVARGYWGAQPRFLRTEAPAIPNIPDGLTVRPLRPDDAAILAAFWRQSYGGPDWYLDADADWVRSYLSSEEIMIFGGFGIIRGQIELMATIACCPFGQGTTSMSHGATLPEEKAFVIEGLCLHPSFRGKGIAAYLIGLIDATISSMGPVVLFYSRELSSHPILSTALNVQVYAFIQCQAAQRFFEPRRIEYSEFVDHWSTSSQYWISSWEPRIVANRISPTATDIDVWRVPTGSAGTLVVGNLSGGVALGGSAPVGSADAIVVVSNTRRRSKKGERIWEVLWCGHIRANNHMQPAKSGDTFKNVLESVAAQYEGLFFCTSMPVCGGASAEWGAPWVYGSSGVHAWYIYNYIPPAFGNCEVFCIRNEL